MLKQISIKSQTKKKKAFLLLEILIAIFIVSLCFKALVYRPLMSYRKELLAMEQLERDRLAEWTFIEIQEMLLKNDIPWKKLPKPGQTSELFTLPPKALQIPGCEPKEVERRFSFYCYKRGQKETAQGEVYRHFAVQVKLLPRIEKKKRYLFSTIVKKKTIS